MARAAPSSLFAWRRRKLRNRRRQGPVCGAGGPEPQTPRVSQEDGAMANQDRWNEERERDWRAERRDDQGRQYGQGRDYGREYGREYGQGDFAASGSRSDYAGARGH